MKLSRCVPLLAAVASCAAPTARPTGAPFAERTRLAFHEGAAPERPIRTEAVFVPLIGAVLNFALGQLKGLALARAEAYEVKSKADAGVRMAVPATGARQGLFLLLRTREVPADAQGIPLEKDLVPLVLDSRGEDMDGPDERASLIRKLDELGTWAQDWLDGEIALVADLPAKASNRAVVLSLAAIVHLRPSDVDSGGGETMQAQLVAYTYPLQKYRTDAYAELEEARKDVKALLTLVIESPQGHPVASPELYEAAVTWSLRSDAQRATKGQSQPVPSWIASDTGKEVSSLLAGPPVFFNARATLVETSNIKKTLENLAKLIGEVKLTPKDLGIE